MACGDYVDLLCVVWPPSTWANEEELLAILALLGGVLGSARVCDVADLCGALPALDIGHVVRGSTCLH